MGKYGFKDLQVWKESKGLAVDIYNLTSFGEINRDYDLRSQIRRAAISIPSNIAEGDERGTDKESVRFFYIAKGSLAEIITQFEIAKEIGYIDEIQLNGIESKCSRIGRMLGSLIKSRSIEK
ncbi:MAG TPA: four helix bundle protein [Clostridia bacterium]|nr:four helix bundle protein [Clostridia bacterium]